jgi:HEAT repeat protein
MDLKFLLGRALENISRLFSFVPVSLLFLAFFAGLGNFTKVQADGMFVAPKFVWDKHKDINEPTQKAIIVYDGGREDLILQVKYEGPVSEFGWLIPVPNLPTVQKGSMKCFYELSQYTQKLWEPPVYGNAVKSLSMAAGGDEDEQPEPVKVIEIKTIGAYEIAVLATKDTGALEKWLEANDFSFPANATDVIDSYVKRQWYFVAAKVNLKQGAMGLVSSALKLPAGELNPLQISFASDKCVFPLKISSANGTPSEIQVYVLSPEPLLEKTMLEKKLPEIYTNDLAWAEKRALQFEESRGNLRNIQRRVMGGGVPDNSPLTSDEETMAEGIKKSLMPTPDELAPFVMVTKADLPETSQWISRLADKSWWLTKQTWTFRPEEMRDLEFEPAFSAFADLLGTKYGYYADASLTSLGTESIPTILAAMQSTNSTVRVCAAQIFASKYGGYRSDSWNEHVMYDSRFTDAATAWLKDSEPEVRRAGIMVLTSNWKPEFAELLIPILRDKDAEVRQLTTAMLGSFRFADDMKKHSPLFRQMLEDQNPEIQGDALQILQHLHMVIPREDLVAFFKSSDWRALNAARAQLQEQGEKLSDDDAMILLQNSSPVAEMLGLAILNQNPEKKSVELALPLLRDPDEIVRLKAAQTLRALTGQQFTEDQADDWAKWWTENKTAFVAQLQPEESRALPDGQAYHERGCEYYDRQIFTESLADFRKSCELGSEVQDYSYYRIWLIRTRSSEKEAATQDLVAYLKNRKAQNPPDWPLQVGRFLADQITEADFLKAAADENSKTDHEQHCEAYFYAGSKRLIANDQTGAADFFKKCLGTGVTTFEEYHSAEAELNASSLNNPAATDN